MASSVSNNLYGFLFFIMLMVYINVLYTNEINNPSSPLSYFIWLLIVVGQFVWGALSYLSDKPNPSYAFAQSALAVFTTWTLLFLPMFIMNNSSSKGLVEDVGLNFAEELNSIFSNVIGYYMVSSDANSILAKLGTLNTDKDKSQLTLDQANALMIYTEIRGNQTLLINQLTPTNFECEWRSLFKYLFEAALKMNGSINEDTIDSELIKIKDNLKSIVNKKYLIGKCSWYFYTALLAYSFSIYFMTVL